MRLNFPDSSCQRTTSDHLVASVRLDYNPASTHPGKQQGFARVTQSDQENGTSDGFTGEKVLEEH